ncbi:excalibur calcium-binding domain-containing protein [Pseudobacillus badius]|nr:excalibur calcium-binding domain-containing protein [Bacillus badius]OVE46204.1 hypothetical protein B1A98_19695 [Bacillus badius]
MTLREKYPKNIAREHPVYDPKHDHDKDG